MKPLNFYSGFAQTHFDLEEKSKSEVARLLYCMMCLELAFCKKTYWMDCQVPVYIISPVHVYDNINRYVKKVHHHQLSCY